MKTKRAPFSIPFPGRVVPHADEPPYGILLRTFDRNGAVEMYTNFWRAGLDRGQPMYDLDVGRVAFLCSRAEEVVSRCRPVVTTTHVRIGAETVYRDQFSVEHRRWRPACMGDDAYHRVWWDILPIAACPEHGIALTTSCGCARRQPWQNSRLTRCSQKHAYADAARVAAPAGEVAFSTYVRDRLMGRARSPQPLLDDLDLGEAIRVAEQIGRASIDEGRRFTRDRSLHRADCAAEGFRIVQDFGPCMAEVFDRLLARATKRGGPRKWGVEHAYGDVYVWIASYPTGSAFASSVKAAIAAHAERNVLLKTGMKVAGVKVAQPNAVSFERGAEMSGVSVTRFKRLARNVGLVSRETAMGRPVRLDEAHVRAWADKLKTAKTRDDLAEALGVTPRRVGNLARAGFLPLLSDARSGDDERLSQWLAEADAADVP